jgi:hypothetical protein
MKLKIKKKTKLLGEDEGIVYSTVMFGNGAPNPPNAFRDHPETQKWIESISGDEARRYTRVFYGVCMGNLPPDAIGLKHTLPETVADFHEKQLLKRLPECIKKEKLWQEIEKDERWRAHIRDNEEAARKPKKKLLLRQR